MKTILQAFEWYLPADSQHWKNITNLIPDLHKLGITGLWLPPASKAASGVEDVGYGTYDLFDLGEFDQKGTVPTKYGTKDDYLELINQLHEHEIEAYADIVFDHMMGADETEVIKADVQAEDDRLNEVESDKTVEVWTKFTFPGRQGKYDDYVWTWHNFTGVDYDAKTETNEILEFEGHEWDEEVDSENNNFDYLMGDDLDFSVPETSAQLEKWGKWFVDTTNIDGFRLDAVKHIDFEYFGGWLAERSKQMGRDPFVVGEYWTDDLGKLNYYFEKAEGKIPLFDVPLHFNFDKAASSEGEFDMRGIYADTLVATHPELAVTFVDNHDTQEGQALQSWIQPWFKEQAYSLILLRQKGTPTVFWGDLYGIPAREVDPVGDNLRRMIALRGHSEFLSEYDYFDDADLLGWTNTIKLNGEKTGLATTLTNSKGGAKYMIVDKSEAGKVYSDLLGRHTEPVTLDDKGGAEFYVDDATASVWINQDYIDQINQVNE
ncbi:alpha-amylase [Lactococcus fujiensis]|uniref:Alpha-amylase n=1 Tax=Lactococcus fujiensis JCM 16395 TaxID=1291764 RepID=A0A2A5RKK0_9LACT|nr:alpha-amylase [Lactococcus fujiensis]PCR99677.1 Alpha-amylase [Lactococcus fujiensis JCM 16395]